MAVAIMRLGEWTFSVPGLSYDRLRRAFEYRWEPMPRIGSRPAQQFMGPGEERLDIRGVLYPHCFGGYNTLNKMRSSAMNGEHYPLSGVEGGIGYFYGPWCIRLITDEQEYFKPDGSPRKVEFRLDLVVYGTDGADGGKWPNISEGWARGGVRLPYREIRR